MKEVMIEHDHGGLEKQKSGISSFFKNNTDLIFKALDLKQGDVFLDLGCGAGDYSIQASKLIGETGIVYALDKWQELVSVIEDKIKSEKLHNINIVVSDIFDKLNFDDSCIDVCFVGFVLHGMNNPNILANLFKELQRILKVGGKIAIIEIKKENACDTHPAEILLSDKEIEKIISPYNFELCSYVDLGNNYLVQFKLAGK